MALDDADTIRRFISQIKGQSNLSSLNTVTSPSTTQHEQAADEYNKSESVKTPPQGTVAGQDDYHLTSPEAHPKPSPHVSGLKAPFNTPKTAASSPRLAAANTHNEDVADAFSEYVNTLNSRPLSESMWAPLSTRHKPSTLGGARSANVLTPIKAVEPNPAINDTFDRMSFKAADSGHKVDENLIGDHVTKSPFFKAPHSSVNQRSILAYNTRGDKANGVAQAKLEKKVDEDFKRPAQDTPVEKVQKVQFQADEVGKEDSPNTAHTEEVGKENNAPPVPQADIAPPHLRATRFASQKPVKAETRLPPHKELGPVAMSKTADISSVKDGVQAPTRDIETTVTTNAAGTKPVTDLSSGTEDLEHKTFFNSWPKQEEKARPGNFQQNSPVPMVANS